VPIGSAAVWGSRQCRSPGTRERAGESHLNFLNCCGSGRTGFCCRFLLWGKPMGWFTDCFGDLPEPGRGNAQRHDLLEPLTIALTATLCGPESSVDFELFARSKEECSGSLSPEAFAGCLLRFTQGCRAPPEMPACAARLSGRGAARHWRSSMPSPAPAALRSVRSGVPHGDGEIAALRALLQLLHLKARP